MQSLFKRYAPETSKHPSHSDQPAGAFSYSNGSSNLPGVVSEMDNCSALSACVHGYADKRDMAKMANSVRLALCSLGVRSRFNWVPTDANIADTHSRVCDVVFVERQTDDRISRGATSVCHMIPRWQRRSAQLRVHSSKALQELFLLHHALHSHVVAVITESLLIFKGQTRCLSVMSLLRNTDCFSDSHASSASADD